MIGNLSKETLSLAGSRGLPIALGTLRKTDKRVILFCRWFPGAHKSGYALRSRVVWWLHTGEVIKGASENIHHKNGIRSDDRFSNLEKMKHGLHSSHHNASRINNVSRTCKACRKAFDINAWRLKEENRGKFCSQQCYQAYPRSDSHKQAISNGLKKSHKKGNR